MIKRIIFDLDNTLIMWKDEYEKAADIALNVINYPKTNDLYKKINEVESEYEEGKTKFDQKEVIDYLNEKLKSINPCLSRGVSKKSGKGVNGIYNEDFDKNLILIEVGGQYNNIIEVSNTLEIFAKILSLYINEDSNEKT